MKNLIQGNYPGLPINDKFKAYIQLTRPFTVISAFIISVVIYAYSTMYYEVKFDFGTAFMIGISLSCLQAFGQIMNQAQRDEIKIDKDNGKNYRPIVRGVISPAKGMTLGVGYLIIGLLTAFLLNYNFFIICSVISFIAWSYTYKPFRFKKVFIVNNMVQALSRGLLPFLAVFSIYGFEILPFIYGTIIAIWVFGAQTTKDFGDIAGDRKYDVKTIPVVLGEKALWLITFSFISAFSLLIISVFMNLLPDYYIITNILVIPSVIIILTVNKISVTENNMGWMTFYLTLALWSLMPLIGLVIWNL